MLPFSRALARPRQASARNMTPTRTRALTAVIASKKEGDISSVFASLSGRTPASLPHRFADVKRKLIQGREAAVTASWKRLLEALHHETRKIEALGSAIIPSIQYNVLHDKLPEFQEALKVRGAGVIRGVVPQGEARAYKNSLDEYIKANPSTKGELVIHKPFRSFELIYSPSISSK